MIMCHNFYDTTTLLVENTNHFAKDTLLDPKCSFPLMHMYIFKLLRVDNLSTKDKMASPSYTVHVRVSEWKIMPTPNHSLYAFHLNMYMYVAIDIILGTVYNILMLFVPYTCACMNEDKQWILLRGMLYTLYNVHDLKVIVYTIIIFDVEIKGNIFFTIIVYWLWFSRLTSVKDSLVQTFRMN